MIFKKINVLYGFEDTINFSCTQLSKRFIDAFFFFVDHEIKKTFFCWLNLKNLKFNIQKLDNNSLLCLRAHLRHEVGFMSILSCKRGSLCFWNVNGYTILTKK